MRPVPNLSVIAAVAANGVIGRNNDLPWHLPADLAHFKRITLGKPILMGRRTWESLPGLLPHRNHIVVSRSPGYEAEGAMVASSLDEALAWVNGVEEALIIGGAQLYAQALPIASRLYLTKIDAAIDGDTFFPDVDWSAWQEVEREQHLADSRNAYPYTFLTWDRR